MYELSQALRQALMSSSENSAPLLHKSLLSRCLCERVSAGRQVVTILKADGTAYREPGEPCDHGITFDEEEAERILGNWEPRDSTDFVMGNPAAAEVRRRWPRLNGRCPLGCGYVGIYYASPEHYTLGDW